MPSLPRLSGRPSLDGRTAEGLLAGRGHAPGAPAGQQALARVLEAAASTATDRELAEEAAFVAGFVLATSPVRAARVRRARRRPRSRGPAAYPAHAGPPAHPAHPGPPAHPGRRPRSRGLAARAARASRRPRYCGPVRMAVALAAGVIAIGGTAAFAAVLPPQVQELAHTTFGAPAPRHRAAPPRVTRRAARRHGTGPGPQPGPDATTKASRKTWGHEAVPPGWPGDHRPGTPWPPGLPGPAWLPGPGGLDPHPGQHPKIPPGHLRAGWPVTSRRAPALSYPPD